MKKLRIITLPAYKKCCYFDAIPDGNVGFVAAGCTFAAQLKHQKSVFRPRAVRFSSENIKKKSPRNGLLKPFLGLSSLAGAVRFELTARGFGGDVESPKSTWICRFQAIFVSEKYY